MKGPALFHDDGAAQAQDGLVAIAASRRGNVAAARRGHADACIADGSGGAQNGRKPAGAVVGTLGHAVAFTAFFPGGAYPWFAQAIYTPCAVFTHTNLYPVIPVFRAHQAHIAITLQIARIAQERQARSIGGALGRGRAGAAQAVAAVGTALFADAVIQARANAVWITLEAVLAHTTNTTTPIGTTLFAHTRRFADALLVLAAPARGTSPAISTAAIGATLIAKAVRLARKT